MTDKKLTKTLKFKIKNPSSHFNKLARKVNFVWNYCSQTSYDALRNQSKWLSAFDLMKLSSGSSKELGLHSQSINMVCDEFVTRRIQFKKAKLRWRGKKSLGWIPFSKTGIQIKNSQIKFGGKVIKVFESERLPEAWGAGQIVEDARGHWYICLTTKVDALKSTATKSVGIDLGAKTLATLSDGTKYESGKYFRQMAARLARVQRAGNKSLAKSIHRKIKNKRLDTLHKSTTEIAKNHALIVVGKIQTKKLTKKAKAKPNEKGGFLKNGQSKKRGLNKSILDNGLGMFRTLLAYKARAHQQIFVEVNETNTTRTCSSCGEIPASSPKGVKGLALREWVCCCCGAVHDRDVNAALNILRIGRDALAPKVA